MVLSWQPLNQTFCVEPKANSFLGLYKPVSSKISNYCRLINDSDNDAEDLLHATIIAVYEKMNQLKSYTAFSSLRSSTSYNIYSKELRRRNFQEKDDEQAALFLQNVEASLDTIHKGTIRSHNPFSCFRFRPKRISNYSVSRRKYQESRLKLILSKLSNKRNLLL